MKDDRITVSHLMPCSVVLLSAASGKKKDIMTATAMFVTEDPSLLVVSVAKNILTHQLIEESGEFVLNIASEEQIKLARALGATHGTRVDKFKKFHLAAGKARVVGAPLLKGSFAHLECKVVTSTSLGKYTLFLSQVVDGQGNEKSVPLVWQANRYYALKKAVN